MFLRLIKQNCIWQKRGANSFEAKAFNFEASGINASFCKGYA